MSDIGGGSPGPSHRGKGPQGPARDIGKALMQLPAVLESISDGFVAISRDWRYTYANAAAARVLKRPVEQLVGSLVFEAFPDARGTDFEEGFRKALEQNVATTFEAHYPPLKAWFECRCHPGSDGISIFFTDVTQRKQAQEAMHRSERLAKSRLREIETIYNSAHVGLCVFDRNLRFIRINNRLAEINGIPAAQHIGKTVREVLPGLADMAEELAERIFRTGEPVLDFQFSGVTAAQPGAMRHWVEHWLPLKTDSGRVVGINIVVHDVTQQKEAENRLAYLASFPQRNPNPILEVDSAGDVRFMNPAAIRLFPDLAEQGISHPWLANWDAVMAPFREGRTETGLRDVTIGERTYQQAFYYSSQEGFIRIYGFDITDRKKAEVALQEANERLQAQAEELQTQTEELQVQTEELQAQQEELQMQAEELTTANEELREGEQALRQSEARYRSLAENMPSVLMRYDSNLRIVYLSPKAQEITGVPIDQFIGKTNRQVGMPHDLCSLWENAIGEVFRTGGHKDLEFSFPSPEGPKTFYLKLAPEFGSDGAVMHVLGISTDITERKKAEQKLRSQRALLEGIIENIPVLLCIWDPQLERFQFNQHTRDVLGWTEADAGSDFMTKVYPDPAYRQEVIDYMLSLESGWRDLKSTTKDGTAIDISWANIRLDDGTTIGIGIDIRRRKADEQALQEANELLQAQSEELAATNEELQVANEELRMQEQALQESLHQTQRTAERLNLLSDTAASLLASDEPQVIVDSLCQAVMKFLDCQAFFNFLVDEQAGRLHLNACAGVPKRDRKKIEWLDYGTTVCGCVVRDGQRFVAENIPDSDDEPMTLAKSYGLIAYACHPIVADAKVLGTLSFGTKTRETFRDDELTLMKAVTDMVALAVQRQQVRQALSESERRYRTLFEQMNEGFGLHEIVCDDKGQPCDYRFLDVNPAFEQLTGLKRENVVGRLVSEVLPDNDSCWVETFGRVAITGEPTHLEQYSTPLQRYYDVYAYRPAPGQFAVVFMDVTQRRQMEAELRRLNEQLEQKVAGRTEQLTRSVDRLQDEMTRRVLAEGKLRKHSRMLEGFFRHTITPLAFLDSRFNFVQVNEAYAHAEGKGPKYFVGKNHFELYPHEENREIFEQVVRTKQPYRAYARPFTYPDDPQRVTYWDWQLTPLLSEFGDVQFLVLNLADVTEQQQALQELERRATQLQHLTLELSEAEDRERRRLAEILHDDLQQMLAAAKFHLGILSSRVKDNESAQEIAGQISQMLREAIDQSRSLSHELSPAVLYEGDLGETFEWLAQQVHSKHGLLVHVETHGRVESHSDAIRAFLFRTAQEMLFNIVKHAKANEARLRLRRVRGRIWMTISDQGRGFDPRALSRSAGFGLLSIRERVELLGGRMRIRSAPDRGSTFLLAVPDAQRTEDGGHKTTNRPDPSSVLHPQSSVLRLRVLLVDDHEVVREGLAALLSEQEDMEVVGQAGNGREAVDLVNKLQPDVVVMDASMPVMAGDEATRQIKQLLPDTRVIALSMFEEGQVARRMRKAGAETYLLKTAPSEQLLAAIRGKC